MELIKSHVNSKLINVYITRKWFSNYNYFTKIRVWLLGKLEELPMAWEIQLPSVLWIKKYKLVHSLIWFPSMFCLSLPIRLYSPWGLSDLYTCFWIYWFTCLKYFDWLMNIDVIIYMLNKLRNFSILSNFNVFHEFFK